MAKVTLGGYVLEDVLLTIKLAGGPEGDDYSRHVSKVELVPARGTVTWQGLSPDATIQRAGRASWVANVDHVQDWETPASLSRFLLEHDGEQAELLFQPRAGAGLPSFTATGTLASGPIGGATGAVPVGSITIPLDGKPVPDWDNDPLTPNV